MSVPPDQMQQMAPPDMAQQGQPEAQDDPQAEAQFEQILAGLLNYVFGKGRNGIEKQLQNAKNVPDAIGKITYTLVEEAAKQAQQRQLEVDMDVMFGVAAELIDSLIRLAQAMGKKLDEDAAREESMMVALQTYLMSAKADPEQQQIAQQMLAEMQADGSVDMAAQEIQRIGKRAGVDPFAQQDQPKPRRRALMGG